VKKKTPFRLSVLFVFSCVGYSVVQMLVLLLNASLLSLPVT